ncbi:hypothetical protein MOJ79_07085 [Calidifontimicrobium sp. SYSU G02091]|uniref:hypothetical protein n=1 Tax=Calidifontimicrobium sp. SYSU G02091 TaxID=2926421 RepID=UPI001F52FF88|nr:hypothetical protein [Calidifontimicrobium sp. SYSU G02091]MCI1191601.1 hypothetical protein [Calidifontimicrobium sp. SYSU G02091]
MSRYGGDWGDAAFGALLGNDHLRLLLARCATRAERMALVERLREAAAQRLADAAARLGADVTDFADDDRAVVLCLALADASPAERRAAALLRACVLARELGDVAPYADKARGAAFSGGRAPGSGGPVRLWLRRYVAAHPQASAAEAWDALKRRPPRGCKVFGDAGRRGAHVTVSGGPDMGYRRFANVLAEERQKAPK